MKKIYSWTLFFLLLLLCHYKSNAQCVSTGIAHPQTFNTNGILDTPIWDNVNNTDTADGLNTTSSFITIPGTPVTGNLYVVKEFGLNIPANSTICGILVSIKRKQTGDNSQTTITDHSMQLLQNGIFSNSYPNLSPWDTTYSIIQYGGSADTWGLSWTPELINSGSFAVAINVTVSSGCCSLPVTAEIDEISIEVFYQETEDSVESFEEEPLIPMSANPTFTNPTDVFKNASGVDNGIIIGHDIYNGFTVKTSEAGTKEIRILNLSGYEVKHFTTDENQMNIPTGDFHSGLYIVLVETSTNKTVQKFYLQ